MELIKDELYEYDARVLYEAIKKAGFDPDKPKAFSLKSRVNEGTIARILRGHKRGMPIERAKLIRGATAIALCRILPIEPVDLCPGAPQPAPPSPPYAASPRFNDWRTRDDARRRRYVLNQIESAEVMVDATAH